MRRILLDYAGRLLSSFRNTDSVKVVALGHQKSGTTAIAGLIAKAARYTLASDPLYQIDKGSGGAAAQLIADPSSLGPLVRRHRTLFCSAVLKDPDLTFVAAEAIAVFSEAKFLFVMRDPRTAIRSIADRLSLTANDLAEPAWITQLPNRHWELILSGKLPEVSGGSVAEVLARRWVLAAEAYERHADVLTLVRYEEFLADKAGTVERTMKKLGVRMRCDISADVDIAFQPKGNSKLPLEDRLGEKNLRQISAICGKKLSTFDYSLG